MKDLSFESPPLTRAGRRHADVTMAAARFKLSADGSRWVRHYEVHGLVVTESVGAR
jgi:hypothetical protein